MEFISITIRDGVSKTCVVIVIGPDSAKGLYNYSKKLLYVLFIKISHPRMSLDRQFLVC